MNWQVKEQIYGDIIRHKQTIESLLHFTTAVNCRPYFDKKYKNKLNKCNNLMSMLQNQDIYSKNKFKVNKKILRYSF